MEITSRQLGRIEACCFALEEATEKNNVAARLVKILRENLEEITQTAFPGELDHDWDMEFQSELEKISGEQRTAAESGSASATHDEIRAYGQDLVEQGISAKDLIKMVMEYFDLSQTDFAQLIGVNQGSLSKYINKGERRDAVLTGLTEYFGEKGGAK